MSLSLNCLENMLDPIAYDTEFCKPQQKTVWRYILYGHQLRKTYISHCSFLTFNLRKVGQLTMKDTSINHEHVLSTNQREVILA